jgi:hypothetical protein
MGPEEVGADVNALKPCPFGCTHTVDIELSPDAEFLNEEAWFVECGCCLCRGPWASTRPKAAELWNKRGEM